jgi:imidazolonepropionase-like amidohydrolase
VGDAVPEVLTAPRVITGDETIADGAVVIGGRTVAWAGAASVLPDRYLELPRTNYPHATIMPGLIDSHVHLAFDGGRDPAARMRAETDEQQLALMLCSAAELLGAGVTTARDLGGRGYLAVAARDAIAGGVARGPRLLVAASPVTVTRGHCWYMGGEAETENDLRRLVRAHHEHGADLIKVMATGGYTTDGPTPWEAQYSRRQLAVIAAEAARAGLPVSAHAHGVDGIRRAAEAGVTTIEHCSFATGAVERRFSAPVAASIAARGIVVCPAISANTPRVAARTGIAIGAYLKAMHDMGVRIITGTDSGIADTPHGQYAGGLAHLVALGFNPAQVLAMATTQAAEALGVGSITGRLAPGYAADLIVVDGDPAADITALGRLIRITARGRDYAPPR